MVIASGDMDFVPLVVRLREKGIKVICVTEHAKIAADAIPSYDHVLYVGAGRAVISPKAMTKSAPAAIAPAPLIAKQSPATTPATKQPASKPAPKKKAPAAKAAKKTASAAFNVVVTAESIIAALPKLRAGEWLPLSEIGKMLHDQKLLAKNATSPKLFRKFPTHFELAPAAKPNKVRFLKA